MGGSRRRLKRSRAKVQVGLPRKNPNVFKPAFSLPPKLRALMGDSADIKWDPQGSVISNYNSFGFVSNPNLLGVRSRTPHIVQDASLQVPPPKVEIVKDCDCEGEGDCECQIQKREFANIDSGSDLEEDDLKEALGKRRRDGKSAPLQPLTTMQRVHVRKLIEKYGDNYQSMFMDTKLNSMQHSIATLEKLCKRYHMHGEKNPLLVST